MGAVAKNKQTNKEHVILYTQLRTSLGKILVQLNHQ